MINSVLNNQTVLQLINKFNWVRLGQKNHLSTHQTCKTLETLRHKKQAFLVQLVTMYIKIVSVPSETKDIDLLVNAVLVSQYIYSSHQFNEMIFTYAYS